MKSVKIALSVEYMVILLDNSTKTAKLSLRQSEILDNLNNVTDDIVNDSNSSIVSSQVPTFHPEFGRYMIESTPGVPYSAGLKELLTVEVNMRLRRNITKHHLPPNHIPITLTSFPTLGVNYPFLDPHYEPNGEASQSLFLPDELINPHVRFPTLAANIRKRRGAKVAINVPIFFDENTPRPFIDKTIPYDRDLFPGDKEAKEGAAKPDHIYMDAMGFGMGCSCLQLTFQACNVNEAFNVYDALAPVAPIMLALTAAAPIYRGYLSDVDARWNVISAAVDDRTKEERGEEPLKNDKYRIPKSRYDSIDSYLSTSPRNRPEYNDNPLPMNKEVHKALIEAGIELPLANHIAHLFIRDPIVIFNELLKQDNTKSSDHFENIQSTNWQTLRFKPPPPQSKIGWRVEFRSMEVQLTDFENAAFSVFIVLLTRAILSFDLNFYMPISKVDVNMQRSQKRDGSRQEKFFFRKNLFPKRDRDIEKYRFDSPRMEPMKKSFDNFKEDSNMNGKRTTSSESLASNYNINVEEEIDEMSMDEIINGKDTFPGLMGLVYAYLHSLNVDIETKCQIKKYLQFIKDRASGKYITFATWTRNFMRSHPDYKQDSVITSKMNYDFIIAADEIERGIRTEPSLLPPSYIGSDKLKEPSVMDLSQGVASGAEPDKRPTPTDGLSRLKGSNLYTV
ncbi:GCS-domain-containing protein [Wallemia mellicola]|nr:GCS-domain-containing protein [Wallemia mellicola]